MEDVQLIAEIEVICERFFRICSMITKKVYVILQKQYPN